jgi:hypothetical protein
VSRTLILLGENEPSTDEITEQVLKAHAAHAFRDHLDEVNLLTRHSSPARTR